MSVAARRLFDFDSSFVRDLDGLYERWNPSAPPAPSLVVLNEGLARELGVDPDALRRDEGVALLAGGRTEDGAVPVAQAYAGHQFGGWSPSLGDGRAVLLGELIDVNGCRRDLHLKGAGRTPFTRGGDGKAALGPMLREHLIGEAMYALGIPTTRALAVVATGERIRRDTLVPGAVLARVASSHLRVGTFEYAAARRDLGLLRRLADYAIGRHHPYAADRNHPYLDLLDGVIGVQAELVARWMLVGFVHGVMNTDNMTISGETIDYGPCAFMDAYDTATVFSSIDHAGRYAYGNQPQIAHWNLARLAESLLPLLGDDVDAAVVAATEVLQTFPDRYERAWRAGMRAKLGLGDGGAESDRLIDDLLSHLQAQRIDMTSCFRRLSAAVAGDTTPVRTLFANPEPLDTWLPQWRARVAATGVAPDDIAAAMDRVNPIYIPRNHLVEQALVAATDGDLLPYERLVEVVTRPFDEQPGRDVYAAPAPATAAPYRTFCGT